MTIKLLVVPCICRYFYSVCFLQVGVYGNVKMIKPTCLLDKYFLTSTRPCQIQHVCGVDECQLKPWFVFSVGVYGNASENTSYPGYLFILFLFHLVYMPHWEWNLHPGSFFVFTFLYHSLFFTFLKVCRYICFLFVLS